MEYRPADLAAGTVVRDAGGLRPVIAGQLDEWDTTGLPGGAYLLRLSVLSIEGLSSQTTVLVQVVSPTATPSPSPTLSPLPARTLLPTVPIPVRTAVPLVRPGA
jgi:hypothetical protein